MNPSRKGYVAGAPGAAFLTDPSGIWTIHPSAGCATVHTSSGRRGLTLVEVLVVLGILGLVVAFIFPAVRKVRDAADRVQCTNNLKMIVYATLNYADTYNGALPPLSGSPFDHAGHHPQSFFFSILPFI